jgi:DNA-binding beta-propeller fold protein YncE
MILKRHSGEMRSDECGMRNKKFRIPNSEFRTVMSAFRPAVVLLFCFGCAAFAADKPKPALAWPPPPAEPAVVFVRNISGPADIGVKPPFFSRLADWITGVGREKDRLDKPFGLALDDAGNLLVTDTGANTVCCIDLSRKKWTRWEASGKTRFQSPVAVARHGSTIFVADSALGKVLAFDEKGKPQFEITNELERPSGLALAGDRLLVSDSQRHQVAIFDLGGKFISKFGRRGTGPGEFNFPSHINVDAAGLIYVTDSLNGRIQVFDASGRFQRSFGSAGDGPGHFSRPKGVAVDRAGHVYVVDAVFDNVQVFDGQGRLLMNWGETGPAPGEFWLPNAIVISAKNEIYVADSYNHRIQVFSFIGKQ